MAILNRRLKIWTKTFIGLFFWKQLVTVSLNKLEGNIKMDIGLFGWEMYELRGGHIQFMVFLTVVYVSY